MNRTFEIPDEWGDNRIRFEPFDIHSYMMKSWHSY